MIARPPEPLASGPLPGPQNPFVPITPPVRLILLGLFGLYAFWIFGSNLYLASKQGESFLVLGFANLWYLFWVIFPFIFYRPNYGWCHPLILSNLYLLLMIVVRRTGLMIGGLPVHIMLPDWNSGELTYLLAYGNFVSSIAFIGTYVGFFYGPRLRVPRLQVQLEARPTFYIILLAALALVAVVFYLYIGISGGGYNLLLNLSRGATNKMMDTDVAGTGQYGYIIKAGSIIAIIWAATQRHVFRNPVFWPVAAATVFLAYLVDGKRSAMIYPALLILFAWMLRNRAVPYLRLVFFGVAAFAALGILGLFRQSNYTSTQSLQTDFIYDLDVATLYEKTMTELSTRTGAASTYYPILAKVPNEERLLLGRSYAGWVTIFVPRALWPDKPRGVDVRAGETFNGASWGMPPGAVGEAYWNFHLPGVFATFFLVGVCLNLAGRCLERYPNAPAVIALYVITVFYLEPSQGEIRSLIVSFVPALLIFLLGGMLRFGGGPAPGGTVPPFNGGPRAPAS